MHKTDREQMWQQIVIAGVLLGTGVLAARAVHDLLRPTGNQKTPSRVIEEKLAAAYLAEHEMLWREVLTRLAGHKTALHISVTALAALLTVGLAQAGWRDALLGGPILGLVSTAMLLRQWQGWTMATYYFQQRLQPGYLGILTRLGGEHAPRLTAPPLDWVNYVNTRSREQPYFHRQMLRFLWFSDYLLPMALGAICLIGFVVTEPGKLGTRRYALVVGVDVLVAFATLLLVLVFRRWRRRGFSTPGSE